MEEDKYIFLRVPYTNNTTLIYHMNHGEYKNIIQGKSTAFGEGIVIYLNNVTNGDVVPYGTKDNPYEPFISAKAIKIHQFGGHGKILKYDELTPDEKWIVYTSIYPEIREWIDEKSKKRNPIPEKSISKKEISPLRKNIKSILIDNKKSKNPVTKLIELLREEGINI